MTTKRKQKLKHTTLQLNNLHKQNVVANKKRKPFEKSKGFFLFLFFILPRFPLNTALEAYTCSASVTERVPCKVPPDAIFNVPPSITASLLNIAPSAIVTEAFLSFWFKVPL